MLMLWRCGMKTEWLRNTIKDFDPYFVAPIAEKHVINANENYFNVLSIPAVNSEYASDAFVNIQKQLALINSAVSII